MARGRIEIIHEGIVLQTFRDYDGVSVDIAEKRAGDLANAYSPYASPVEVWRVNIGGSRVKIAEFAWHNGHVVKVPFSD